MRHVGPQRRVRVGAMTGVSTVSKKLVSTFKSPCAVDRTYDPSTSSEDRA